MRGEKQIYYKNIEKKNDETAIVEGFLFFFDKNPKN